MLFLGKAANLRGGATWRHTFAFGTQKDSQRLTQYLAQHYNTTPRRVMLYHSGRSAICAGLKKMLPEGGEVLINGLTCYAVVQSVKEAGCTPVFVDITPETLHYDARSLMKTLAKHPKARAVIVQNTLGIPVDIATIERVAEKYKLFLIEDLAHCAGVKYADGREVGTVGDAAMLSFGKGKAVDTSTGGALILRHKNIKMPSIPTQKPKLSESLRDRWYPFFGLCMRGLAHVKLDKPFVGMLRLFHWIQPSADTRLSLTTRLTHWQAKLALGQIEHFTEEGCNPLRGFCLVKNRDRLLEELRKSGYRFEEIWYDYPVSPERYYAKIDFPANECPHSVKVSQTIVNWPLYYSLEDLHPALKIIRRYKK